jgi:hypothetical protein
MALRQSLDKLVMDLESLTSSDDVDAIRETAIVEAEIREWESSALTLVARARSTVERLERQRVELSETLDQRLARMLRDRGLTVHGEGALLIANGVVHVEINPKAALIRINGTSIDNLSCSSVAARVAAEVQRLRALITPPEEMLRQLSIAYQREIASRKDEAGVQVRATSMLVQLAFLRQRPAFVQNPSLRNYREYPRDLFRADLYSLLVEGSDVIDGKRFRYASGSDTAGAIFMLVPALGRPAHVGRLWFETVR